MNSLENARGAVRVCKWCKNARERSLWSCIGFGRGDFAGAVGEQKMPGVLGGVFLHYAGEGAEAGRCAILHAETHQNNTAIATDRSLFHM